ncbi:hypothetical protein RDWZM_006787, partial [Blomia tropicalis]
MASIANITRYNIQFDRRRRRRFRLSSCISATHYYAIFLHISFGLSTLACFDNIIPIYISSSSSSSSWLSYTSSD